MYCSNCGEEHPSTKEMEKKMDSALKLVRESLSMIGFPTQAGNRLHLLNTMATCCKRPHLFWEKLIFSRMGNKTLLN